MKVTLIDCTGFSSSDHMYAADILIFTKNTRLQMSASTLEDVKSKPLDWKMKELEYMSNTIPSSWEFVDYTFMIEGVGRGFTHQFVRTRTGSYAQQSMRVTDMSEFDYVTPDKIYEMPDLTEAYTAAMQAINDFYHMLIDLGAEIQDARGVLPTNICTNIVAKFNLRTLAEMAQKRSSIRTQDEYRKVLDAIINQVIQKHPWAQVFLRNRKMDAAAQLEQFIINYAGNEEQKNCLIKLVDILRG